MWDGEHELRALHINGGVLEGLEWVPAGSAHLPGEYTTLAVYSTGCLPAAPTCPESTPQQWPRQNKQPLTAGGRPAEQ